ncbi:ABC transporter ATP-binding protein [Consotaella salsifontis]|uniref:Spermidine/putrescine import ATP-binding protein PotA n=1 Tax=Consotaella salsifontis TaxID=1365950 RepID=A0A1T4SWX0_9HYPH|nr:ABC transporter ATP-binding protein [Consotaella salsifontis]SKA32652.1 putative spermidine/putrescine transport system ATP-binding protein [Consotaella salsifontis]
MSFVEIEGVGKSFGPNAVLKDFNLTIAKGEFISLLGPSGCGKTTMLRIIAGFESATTGRVRIGGEDVTRLPPNKRHIGMVFQAYALFPNLSVFDNVAFGLKVAGQGKAEIARRVMELLELIKLPDLAHRYPYQLSGGQQQRVALARALAPSPRVLLLDEPLSALDAKIRVSLREEIRSLQRELGITTIFVTHDQEEALSMSDRIVVMNAGCAEQIGTPFEIYNHPRSRFVASFVGTLNALDGVAVGEGVAAIDGQTVAVPGLAASPSAEQFTLALRPESVSLSPRPEATNRLNGTIEDVSFLGSVVRIRLRIGGSTLLFDTFNNPASPPPPRGANATVHFAPGDLQVLESGPVVLPEAAE